MPMPADPKALQRRADAAAAGDAPRCNDVRVVRGEDWRITAFVCICPPHGGTQPYVDAHRRRTQGSVSTDHHYYVPQA